MISCVVRTFFYIVLPVFLSMEDLCFPTETILKDSLVMLYSCCSGLSKDGAFKSMISTIHKVKIMPDP